MLRLRAFLLRFHRDERGQLFALYALGALFTVALVYLVAGVGGRLIQKENLQGAADAGAFAGAVVEAKALNQLSFLNLVLSVGIGIMAVLYAVVAAIGAWIPIGIGLCLFDPVGCSYVPRAPLAIAQYTRAATQLQRRLRPIQLAAQRVALAAPRMMMLEALQAARHPAYTANEPGAVPRMEPPFLRLPVERGPSREACGPAANVAANGAAILGFALLNLPADMPVSVRGIVSAQVPIWQVTTTATICAGGTSGLRPMRLTRNWDRLSGVGVAVRQTADRGAIRRSMLVAAARSRATPPRAVGVTTTARADVYSTGGPRDEDLWHMSWRARLVLSRPLHFPTAAAMPPDLARYWVH